jgi:hypothetical protein
MDCPNPMSAIPQANISQHGTRSRIDVLHLVVVLILSALPAAAATAFPPDALADKNQTFITLYVVTLPWSLAVSAIVAGFAGGWFGPDDRKQVLAVAGILLVSAVLGGAIAPGSPLDEHFQGGPPWVVVSEAIVFGLIGYALMYGWPMWFASFFVAAYVGWWVHEKHPWADVADVASTRLTPRSGEPAPRASGAGVAIAVETSNLTPHVRNDLTFQRRSVGPSRRPPDELAELTKAELYQRAREVGIKGRSAMSKAQLLAELRAEIGRQPR